MTADRNTLATGSSRRQFNIFPAFEIVLDNIERREKEHRPVTEEVRHAFFERAIRQYTTILEYGKLGVGPFGGVGLIARCDRHEFFEKIHQDYLKYLPAGYKEPSGFRGVKFWLIKKNAYWTYSLLDPANKVRVRMGHGARRLLRRVDRHVQ